MENMEVTVATQQEADAVIRAANRLHKVYGQFFLSDLKDLIGETPTWEDEQLSWISLNDVKIEKRDDLFVIVFPKPAPYVRK